MSTKRAKKSKANPAATIDYSEKPDGKWVDVTKEFMEEPKKLEIPLFTSQAKYGDREYHAVGIFMDVLGQRHLPYVAMAVTEGENLVGKHIELDDVAHRFFVTAGLPIPAAKALVSLAAAIRNEELAKAT